MAHWQQAMALEQYAVPRSGKPVQDEEGVAQFENRVEVFCSFKQSLPQSYRPSHLLIVILTRRVGTIVDLKLPTQLNMRRHPASPPPLQFPQKYTKKEHFGEFSSPCENICENICDNSW